MNNRKRSIDLRRYQYRDHMLGTLQGAFETNGVQVVDTMLDLHKPSSIKFISRGSAVTEQIKDSVAHKKRINKARALRKKDLRERKREKTEKLRERRRLSVVTAEERLERELAKAKKRSTRSEGTCPGCGTTVNNELIECPKCGRAY